VKKAGVAAPREKLVEIANWLADRGVAAFVERAVHAAELPGLPPFDPKTTAVDFAITLGGDGTVLHLASMFEGGDTPLPPVVCFAMGTLGFLTAFSADEFGPTLERVLAADRHPLYCTLRTRTRVDVLLPVDDEGEGILSSSPDPHHDHDDGNGRAPTPSSPDNNNHQNNRRPSVRLASTRHVLNECVVDRGAFPHAVYIEIFVDGVFVTAAEADGLVVATPSGSTAYSMSAGGPMVSPSVPCTLLTPLSPQSLSFRPLVIPESSELLISVPRYARSHARLSFDGRAGQRLPRGSALRVTTSACPLPFINLKPLDGDFFQAIVEKLRWNTLIRGRAGERPEPPVVVAAVAVEEEDEGAEEAAAVAEGRRRR
jgi:NAD+ kinase